MEEGWGPGEGREWEVVDCMWGQPLGWGARGKPRIMRRNQWGNVKRRGIVAYQGPSWKGDRKRATCPVVQPSFFLDVALSMWWIYECWACSWGAKWNDVRQGRNGPSVVAMPTPLKLVDHALHTLGVTYDGSKNGVWTTRPGLHLAGTRGPHGWEKMSKVHQKAGLPCFPSPTDMRVC